MSEPDESQDFPLCYGCGRENPIGFKLQVHQEGDRAWAQFVPGEYHTGWPGMVHGGVLCVLMDEVVSYLPYWNNLRAVTGKMEIRFRRPVPSGQPLRIEAQIVRRKTRTMQIRGSITLSDGSTAAESDCLILATGKEK